MTRIDNPLGDGQLAIRVFSALRLRGLVPLLEQICDLRGVNNYEILGKGRSRSVCRARHELWARIRFDPARHYSFLEIARFFECDHSTVHHGIRAHQRRNQP